MTPRRALKERAWSPDPDAAPPAEPTADYTTGDLLIIEKCRKLKRLIKDLRVEEKGHRHQAKACKEKIDGYEAEIEELLGVSSGNRHAGDPGQMRLPTGDRA